MISRHHSNRKAYNWLIYDIGDDFLKKFSPFYKGVLYDLGCGESPYRDFFLTYADEYIGVDWSGSIHATDADVSADMNKPLPIGNATADTVVSLSALEHLSEPQTMLNEAHRILKPGGPLILQVPFMWWVHEAPYDYYRYTCHGLKYMLDKAGFEEVQIYPMTGFWVMWSLKFNYQSIRLIRGRWLMRELMSVLMRAVWALDQRVAPWLDKRLPCEAETAGYYVLARKPRG